MAKMNDVHSYQIGDGFSMCIDPQAFGHFARMDVFSLFL
jgi:hypothetical protein